MFKEPTTLEGETHNPSITLCVNAEMGKEHEIQI